MIQRSFPRCFLRFRRVGNLLEKAELSHSISEVGFGMGELQGRGKALLGAQLRLLPFSLIKVGFGASPNPSYPHP